MIRVLPDESFDLFQPQVYSVINPGQRLIAPVTAEGSLGRGESSQILEIQTPAIDLQQLATRIVSDKSKSNDKAARGSRQPPKKKDTKAPSREDYLKKSLYSLTLWVGLKSLASRDAQATGLLLPFSFDVLLLPGEIAFPPLRWLLSRPGQRIENIVSTTITGRPSRR
ncbi:MAG: hypothetical protein F6J97_00805 [Leptolyngbya sp. SIO4C1]|nr:hypothetical protein [Leptolyngbya sp. SIO4C1]